MRVAIATESLFLHVSLRQRLRATQEVDEQGNALIQIAVTA